METCGLAAGYNRIAVIHDVAIQARSGRLTAIVGPNGAGKSTAVKAMVGLIPAMGGTILLQGRDVTGHPTEQLAGSGVGYVPQLDHVFPSLTIRENLEMGAYSRRGVRAASMERVLALFPDLALALRRAARTLSGGQRTMLGIGRALMADPKVLILDEPTAGLSEETAMILWNHLLEIRETGVALLVVEQNTTRTLGLADWAYVMAEGSNRLEGPASELLHDEEVVRLYVGTSSAVNAEATGALATEIEPKEAGGRSDGASV